MGARNLYVFSVVAAQAKERNSVEWRLDKT